MSNYILLVKAGAGGSLHLIDSINTVCEANLLSPRCFVSHWITVSKVNVVCLI